MPIAAIWTAIKAFGLWRRIGGALEWIFASPARLLLILAVAMGAIAFAEHRSAAKWEAQAVKVARTLTDERAAAQAAKLAYEAKSRKDAQDADTNHAALDAGGESRFAAYAAAGHGLRQNTTHNAAAAQGSDPAIPESPTPDAIMAEITRVWITRSDWLTCDADWAYAQAAHDWAKVRDQP